MDLEQMKDRVNVLRRTERDAKHNAIVGFMGGTIAAGLGIAEVAVGNPKAAIGLGIGSGVGYVFSLTHNQTYESTRQQITTYEAARYVVDQTYRHSEIE